MFPASNLEIVALWGRERNGRVASGQPPATSEERPFAALRVSGTHPMGRVNY